MATSKAKAGKAKVRARVKKTAKKTSKKKAVKVQASGIGVISTISITTDMKKAIRTGVNNPGIPIKFTYVGSYKRSKLQRKIDRFNSDKKIALIVTVGGNKAYDAAARRATKPFISLLGAAPSAPDEQCYGGFEMRSYAFNENRVQELTDPAGLKFSRSKIVLLQNPNALIAGDEADDWRKNVRGGPILEAGADTTPDENDSSTYQTRFEAIAQMNIDAVVISADPFFQETMDELVEAANGSKKYICYPLQEYADADEPPLPGKAMAYGPSLIDSYEDLGELASQVLGDGAKRPFVAVQARKKEF
jgi:hypothetical protein